MAHFGAAILPGRAGSILPEPILIAGGGIGGLAAAVALADAGFSVRVLERAPSFAEIGAGIQLGPNATRILRAWGLLERLQSVCARPSGIQILDGLSGRPLALVPLGVVAEERYGAPYLVLHRGDLLHALLGAARDRSSIELVTGYDAVQVDIRPGGVDVVSRTGVAASGQALIAADGIFSVLRNKVAPRTPLRFAGKTAWRALIPARAAAPGLDVSWVCLWLGPSAHLVHYPVQGGDSVNLVAVVDDQWTGARWDEAAEPAHLLAQFRRWCAPATSMLAMAREWRKWPLCDLPPLKRWTGHRMTLLGDAAHPVLPFLAQGGALAIEDADTLARLMPTDSAAIPAALMRYEAERATRTARVQAAARRMGNIYHMRGPARWIRNQVLAWRSPNSLLKEFDWLYGYGAAPQRRHPASPAA